MLDALGDRGILGNIYVIFSSDDSEMLGYFGIYAQYVAT
tara:strand:+ start:469 stop:585 length:117 start_codon:yes stop_codon:yes gene_type:complete